jgi:hypothetical protein
MVAATSAVPLTEIPANYWPRLILKDVAETQRMPVGVLLMKKLISIQFAVLGLVSSLAALPLTATIFQQSARLRNKVDIWNKQCGSKTEYDEACDKRRHVLSKELGEFIALVNDELTFLRGPMSPDAPADFIKEAEGRRKIMELEARTALYEIKWLGLPAADPQRKAELAALTADRAALEPDYAETHQRFDGKWISIPVSSISPAPKRQR